MRDPSYESSPLRLEPQKEVHKPVIISHHRLFEEEVKALEGVLHRRHPDEYPQYSPPVTRRKKRVSKRETSVFDQNEDSKTTSGGNDTSHSDEVKDRIGLSNAVRPAVRMQFKSAADRHLNSDNQWLEKMKPGTNVDKVNMASSSFALSSAPTKNIVGSKPSGSTDTSHFRQGLGSNWIPPLQRNASAK